MSQKTIPITELEPLVKKIEIIASVLDLFLQECADAGLPSQDFCSDLGITLRHAPNLQEWLDDLR